MRGIGGSTAAAELAELMPWPNPAPPISRTEREARLAKAQGLMTGIGADAMIVGAGASLRYFAGVGWGATERLVAMILPKSGEPVMICPRFELGSLGASLGIQAEIALWEEHESPYDLAAQVLARMDARSLAIDPSLPFFVFDGLTDSAPEVAFNEIGKGHWVWNYQVRRAGLYTVDIKAADGEWAIDIE